MKHVQGGSILPHGGKKNRSLPYIDKSEEDAYTNFWSAKRKKSPAEL